jgi:CRP-like cAMP-binding protein
MGAMQIFDPVRPLDARSLGGPTLEVQVPRGTRVVAEGQLIGTFFVIRSGSAEIWRGGARVRELHSGECFGEIDPAASAPQDYTVIAGRDLRLLTFSTLGISRLCQTVPQIRARLQAALAV